MNIIKSFSRNNKQLISKIKFKRKEYLLVKNQVINILTYLKANFKLGINDWLLLSYFIHIII